MKISNLDEGFLDNVKQWFTGPSYIDQWAEKRDDAVGDMSRKFVSMREEYADSEWADQIACRIDTFENFVLIKGRAPNDRSQSPRAVLDPAAWQAKNGNHKCAIKESVTNETTAGAIAGAFAGGGNGFVNGGPGTVSRAGTVTPKKKKKKNEGQYGEITHQDQDVTQSEVLVKGMGVYRMDQLEQRIKDRLQNLSTLIDRGEPDQAAKLLAPNSGTYKSLIAMMNAYAEAHDDLAFGDNN
jgi:hypothetical protein